MHARLHDVELYRRWALRCGSRACMQAALHHLHADMHTSETPGRDARSTNKYTTCTALKPLFFCQLLQRPPMFFCCRNAGWAREATRAIRRRGTRRMRRRLVRARRRKPAQLRKMRISSRSTPRPGSRLKPRSKRRFQFPQILKALVCFLGQRMNASPHLPLVYFLGQRMHNPTYRWYVFGLIKACLTPLTAGMFLG